MPPPSAAPDPSTGIPLSSAQERLWFLDQLEPGSTAYLLPVSAWLTGALRVDALRGALTAIAMRHESLRTTFRLIEGQPVQLIGSETAAEFEFVDLAATDATQREVAALSMAIAHAKRPFDLAQQKPWRTLLVRLDATHHLLVVSFHHIAVDGRSLPILFDELAAAYQDFAAASPAAQPASLQYADFTRWHRGWMAGEQRSRQLDYWAKQLSGLEQLDLPTDRQRPRVTSSRGARLEMAIPPQLVEDLTKLHTDLKITKFSLLLAAFAALLHRSTSAADIPIAIPIDNRGADFAGVVGLCVNTTIIRAACADDLEFARFAQEVHGLVAQAIANSLVPFEHVVRTVRGEWRPDSPPLANVLFDYANRSVRPVLDLPGIEARFFEIDHESAKFDVVLSLHMSSDSPSCSARYATDLFEEGSVRRLVEHYLELLAGIVAVPGARLHQLPLLTQRERALVVDEWNRTEVPFPTELCLHQLFEAQVARTPERTAIVHPLGEATYREVNERANRLARRLVELGAGPEVLVGIFLDRSLDLIVAIIAALKAGSAYVPFDAKMTKERIAFMAADAKLRLIITEAAHAGQLPRSVAQVIPAKEAAALARLPADDLPTRASATNAAYVIYTSGSTGTPKGVVVEHRSAVNAVIATIERYRSLSIDKTLFQSSVTFDSSVTKILQSLCNGGTLYIAPERAGFEDILALTERYGIPRLTTTPSELAILNDMPERLAKTIEMIGAAGENLAPTDVDRIVERIPILNIYGPTETTISTTCFKLTKETLPAGGTVPIGKPIMNYQVYILDRHLNPMPIGCIGELCIGGVGVARGYLGAPELTAQKFVPHPFKPGERLYRSGDLARWLADGNIEFRGRIDQQVKIRGYRIELGEIEAELGKHPAIRQAVVTTRMDTHLGAYLTAYYATQPGKHAEPRELQDFLKRSLADYMIPSRFMRLDEFPKMISGKIDRSRLPVVPAPDAGTQPSPRRSDGDSAVQPYIPLHCQMIAIWERLLGRTGISITDSFFALGGHSLLAARMMTEIASLIGRKLPMTLLFEGPTIEQLATAVMRGAAEEHRPVVEVTPGNGAPPLFYLHGDMVGGGYYAIDLARHLGPSLPFYVMAPAPIQPSSRPPDIGAMAREHLRQIRAISPHGPYRLAGYCNGGVVMYEVACQLREQGEEIAFLGLVDALPRSWHLALQAWAADRLALLLGQNPDRDLRWLAYASHLVDRLKGMNSPDYLRAMADRFFSTRQRRQAAASWNVSGTSNSDTLRGHLWSFAHYRPRRLDATAHVFLADEGKGQTLGSASRWEGCASKIVATFIPGHHFAIITDRVADLADAFAKAIGLAAANPDERSGAIALAGCKTGVDPISRPGDRRGPSA